ncbi:MAG: metal-dependent transcriptional regulator [Clostridiales bacterium]|jgi:Mn-dependent DtxR family transcriptional regulator|nr:metal-dependent transcriptional regulator [Clostridiales bacterium]
MPDVVESRENYLEIILLLSRKGPVRSVDVVEKSGYTKPSVSVAMHALEDAGYVTIDASRLIALTEAGEAIARQVYKKHRYITAYIMRTLNMDEEKAEIDACKIEHFISDEMYEAIIKLVDETDAN